MSIQQYLEIKIEIQKHLLNYINEDEENEDSQLSFLEFVQNFDNQDIENQNTPEDISELKSALRLIAIISINHQRTPNFFNKLEKIIIELEDRIKQSLSNSEIFDIFKKSKRLLLFLIERGIITVDKSICDSFKLLKYQPANYIDYFEPEINKFNGFSNDTNDKIFEEKRKRGENDQYLCTLIRNDSINEFISSYNKGDFSLTATISPSIFETNQYLLNKKVTLMEYSAFYGAIQIFQYLYNNNVDLSSTLWFFAIHGKNSEIIHFLEDNSILPPDYSYDKCLVESIKCHHNDIYHYIYDNHMKSNELSFEEICYFASKSIKYHNYETLPEDLKNSSVFYDLCQYDYLRLVEIFLDEVDMNINEVIVFSQKKFHKISKQKN